MDLSWVQDSIQQLRNPIPDLNRLLHLLCIPLRSLHLLPEQFTSLTNTEVDVDAVYLLSHIPAYQEVLLTHIFPTWLPALEEKNATTLIFQYFCPVLPLTTQQSRYDADVALHAYATILSLPIASPSCDILQRLLAEFPIQRIHSVLFSSKRPGHRKNLEWEDYVRNLVAVPAKVANAFGPLNAIPAALEHKSYFDRLCLQFQQVVDSSSNEIPSEDLIASLAFVLRKFVNLGLFPPNPRIARSEVSFFEVTLPIVRDKLDRCDYQGYSRMWTTIIAGLGSIRTSRSIILSLLKNIEPPGPALDGSCTMRLHIKKNVYFLEKFLGRIGTESPNQPEWLETLEDLVVNLTWPQNYSRLFVCYFVGSQKVHNALLPLIEQTLSIWTSADYVAHSLLSRHQYLTSLLLVAVSHLPPDVPFIKDLGGSSAFLSGVSLYLEHNDASIRRCGMLAAEIVARLSGKQLDFGDWDGEGEGKEWARALRSLLESQDLDVSESEESSQSPDVSDSRDDTTSPLETPSQPRPESGYDSDDSLTGYDSPSSRSASPTPSELEQLEKEPTLRVGEAKIEKPVYLAQLGELIRTTGGIQSKDNANDADKIEMALLAGEDLIRRKRDYGTELEENAVNLVYCFIGLQNTYELEQFDEKRQSILIALVACCPRKAAPALIEEFFKNQYSTDQRFVVLNALTLGAGEISGTLPSARKSDSSNSSFPSRTLPLLLHQRYVNSDNKPTIPQLIDPMVENAIKDSNTQAVDPPNISRERRLRLQPSRKIYASQSPPPKRDGVMFPSIAAEFFICPLINRFWLFLRDEQTREERTQHLEGRGQYRAAGTGLILNQIVLSRLLSALAVLVHLARNALEWLAVVAPDALELALTIGSRPTSLMEVDRSVDSVTGEDTIPGKDASVLTAALELALLVLDDAIAIDSGKSLSLEHARLVMAIDEWARGVFKALENGLLSRGLGGKNEMNLERAVAGVLLKIDSLTSLWRRSMVELVYND